MNAKTEMVRLSLQTTIKKHEELFQRLDLTMPLQLLTGRIVELR